MNSAQLGLPLTLDDLDDLDSFYAGPNAEIVELLRRLARGESPTRVVLHSAAGSGRSHLLKGTARAAISAGRHAVFLSVGGMPSEILEGLERYDAIFLDDIDLALRADSSQPNPWSLALLRLLDELQRRQSSLLVSTLLPPDQLGFLLPDLRTRLSALAVFGLRPLDDAALEGRLRYRAGARGLEMTEDAARFLARRLPRDGASLMRAIDALDEAALSAQRRLTLPFVQSVLPALEPKSGPSATD